MKNDVINCGQSKRVTLSLANHVVPRISLDKLLNGANQMIIEHQGQDYCLRITRNEKLILTK